MTALYQLIDIKIHLKYCYLQGYKVDPTKIVLCKIFKKDEFML